MRWQQFKHGEALVEIVYRWGIGRRAHPRVMLIGDCLQWADAWALAGDVAACEASLTEAYQLAGGVNPGSGLAYSCGVHPLQRGWD